MATKGVDMAVDFGGKPVVFAFHRRETHVLTDTFPGGVIEPFNQKNI